MCPPFLQCILGLPSLFILNRWGYVMLLFNHEFDRSNNKKVISTYIFVKICLLVTVTGANSPAAFPYAIRIKISGGKTVRIGEGEPGSDEVILTLVTYLQSSVFAWTCSRRSRIRESPTCFQPLPLGFSPTLPKTSCDWRVGKLAKWRGVNLFFLPSICVSGKVQPDVCSCDVFNSV